RSSLFPYTTLFRSQRLPTCYRGGHREFQQGGLGMARLARSLDQRQDHYDVIVVGSGYGGGVAASRLARAGKRVAVLERGREFLTGEFPTRFPDLRNELQVR